jgi:hypothetical protein
MDGYVILIVALLAGTLTAFYLDVTPYPLGILVLIALLLMRIRKIRQKRNHSKENR